MLVNEDTLPDHKVTTTIVLVALQYVQAHKRFGERLRKI
jgi:hypothetical protein